MAYFILLPAAKADLRNIRTYLKKHAGPETARHFLDGIEGTFEELAKRPQMGRPRPEYDPDARSFPYEKYAIFYFPELSGAIIARVYHPSRDPGGVFEP